MARQYTNNIINESTKSLSGIITYGSLTTLFDGSEDALANYMTLKKDPNTTENIVIGFEFPGTKLIGKLTLNSRSDHTYIQPDPTTGVPTEYTDYYGDESIRTFNLFGSNDATTLQNGTWKNILATFAGRSNGIKQVFEISNPEEFKFYKIEIVDNYGAVNGLGEKIVSPVEIEIMEMVVPLRYLIQDGTDIKSYNYINAQWLTLGPGPVTIEMFNSNGLESIAGIPWNELTSANPSVFATTYYPTKTYEAEMTAVPPSRVILPNGDISILSITGIESITFTGMELNGGMVRLAASVDEGVTWKTYDASKIWVDININNEIELRGFGLSMANINALTRADWDKLTTGKNTLRFAYYFEQDIYTDRAEIDQFVMNVEMKGAWSMAIPGVDYTYSYPNSKQVVVTLLTDGDYKINY